MVRGFNRHAVTPMFAASEDPPWATTTCPASVAAAVAATRVGPADVVVCAVGAGDAPLGWLAAGAGRVLALGTPAELLLVALKCAALARLRPIERRQLWGLEAAGRRVWLLHEAAVALDAPDQKFWRSHEAWVREGLDRIGRLERRVAPPRWAPRRDGSVARYLAWRRICQGSDLVWPGLTPPAGARERWLAPTPTVLADPWSNRLMRGVWGATLPAWLRPDSKLPARVADLHRVDLGDPAALAVALKQATIVDRTDLKLDVPTGVRWVRRSWGANAPADGSPWGGGLEIGG